MGVIARIGQVQRGLGGVQLLLQGEARASASTTTTAEGYLTADVAPVEEMPAVNENDPAFAALHRETRERAMELGEERGLPEEVLHQVLDSVTEPGRFADLVAGYVELPVAEKQALLETLGVEERLRRVLIHVQRQIGMLAGPGRDQVAGPGRAGRTPARDVPPRAAQGHPEESSARTTRAARSTSCARS